MAKEKREDDT